MSVCLLAAIAAASPSVWGTRGLWRVQDARAEGAWQGTAAIRYLYHSTAFANADEPLRRGYRRDMTVYTNDAIGAVGFSPSRYFELFFWHGGIREYSSRHPDSGTVANAWLMGYENWWDWHNAVPGIKLSLPLTDAATLGALVGYGSGYVPEYWRWGKFGLGAVDGLVLSALGTYRFPELLPNVLTATVNIGQLGKQTTSLAAAGEYPMGDFDLFAELVWELWKTDSAYYWAGDRVYLTPGIKLNHLRPVTFDLNASLGLNRATPAFELCAGVSLTGTVYKPVMPTTGRIAGRVSDQRTGAPVAAFINFPQRPGLPAQRTDAREGLFSLAGIEPGEVLVEASARGYATKSLSLPVKAGKTTPVDLRLEPVVQAGMISGTVVDAKTGSPLKSSVERVGTNHRPFQTGSDGSFGFSGVMPGEYMLSASSPGYLTATAVVSVEPGLTARTRIQLVRKGMAITMKVLFDVDKWSLRPESHEALAQAARIMTENPEIRVEIQGHTDSTESEDYNVTLSENRARAVADYLAQKLGIASGRLVVRGYGESRPTAPNETEEGRTLNRRVEFVVLE
jgi:outer membrane protein OmpA-like peptidoglycan-associated protein